MLIKNITLKNFRQYKGKQKMNFSTDPERNITVIRGENGAGKTTLLESFSWCLYKKLNLPNKGNLLNAEVANKLDLNELVEVFVKINLKRNNNEYFIKRSETFKKNHNKEIVKESRDCEIKIKKDNGVLKDLKYPRRKIPTIIPEDTYIYFFFDGERIENLSKSNREGKKDMSEAVENILGLDILLEAEKHLKKIIKNYEEEYDDNNSNEIKSLKKELEDLRNKENKYEKLVDTKEGEIKEVERKIENLTEKIKAEESAAEKQKRRERANQQIENLEQDIIGIKNDVEKINKNNLPEFIASKLLNLFSDKFDLSELKSKGITGIDGSAIDSIIERGQCICGQKIVEGGECYQNLIEQKKYQPPASLGTIIVQFNEKTEDVKNKARDFVKNFEKKYTTIEKKREEKELLIEEVQRLSKELEETEDVKELEKERNKYKDELDELKETHVDNLAKLRQLTNDIKDKEKELDKLALNDSRNTKIAVRKKYANKIKEEILDYYQRQEKETRKKLNKEVANILNELIETKHQIKINDDYTFRVVDIDGEESTSQGQDIIVSFAFIGGLINLAKERHDDIEVTEPYPLIMDAPFAKLSKAHRKNVVNLLPEIVEQFILFTVDSQYEGEVEKTVKEKIGKEYRLDMKMEDEKYTEIIGG